MTEPRDFEACKRCNGRGIVWVDLRCFGFGEGFLSFLSAGSRIQRNDDGSTWHEIVCPRCEGKEVKP